MDGIFDSITGWFTSKNTGDTKSTENADPGMIEGFKNKARAWAKQVVKVYYTPTHDDPKLVMERQKILDRAKYIKKGIEAIFGTLDELEKINLGFVPLIPVALIASSMAAITYSLADITKFMKKAETADALIKSGAKPQEVANLMKNLEGESSLLNFGGIKSIVPVLGVVAVGAWWLSRK